MPVAFWAPIALLEQAMGALDMGAGRIEVAGRAVMSIVSGLGPGFVARSILRESGLDLLTEDQWYPMTHLLVAFSAVSQQVGPNTLRAIGQEIPRKAAFPPDIDSLEKALRSIDVTYRMNHRGLGDIGSYRYEPVGPKQARLVCDNPYPCSMDLGLIEAMAERFRPAESLWVDIRHGAGACRKQGANRCSYEVSW